MALARADSGKALTIQEIAEAYAIPKKFLEQILLVMKHHGLVRSKRGRFGGYILLKQPENITFGRVLRIVDGPIEPLQCLSETAYRKCDDCLSERTCEIRKVFAVVADSTRQVLDNATLADAVADDAKRTTKAKAPTVRKAVA